MSLSPDKRCAECGHSNRLNGRIVHASDCATGREEILARERALSGGFGFAPSHALSIGELRLLAAGWVMEIHGEHQNHADLRAAAKAYAKEQGAEDDTEVHTILRRILIPEGRRSSPAGALVNGSPPTAALDANPGSAVPGGGNALSTTPRSNELADKLERAMETPGDLSEFMEEYGGGLLTALRCAPSATPRSGELPFSVPVYVGNEHQGIHTVFAADHSIVAECYHKGVAEILVRFFNRASAAMNRADGGKQT